jgi:tetratricopeptide (TPR) repeat protein
MGLGCHRASTIIGVVTLAAAAAIGPIATAVPPPAESLISRANRAQLEVGYAVNSDASPVERVELWYTYDNGASWQQFGEDPDRRPPATFAPPQEGLCGLYFVVTNSAGVSGPAPTATTEPHLWLFVDFTAPIAQIHPATLDTQANQRIAHLRWTALDPYLVDRPVDLAYRVLPEGPWQEVRTRLPNIGYFDWTLPEDVHGELMFRLTITDRGGNATVTATPALQLDGEAAVATLAASPVGTDGLPLPRAISPTDEKRVRDLIRRAHLHQLRQEHDAAISRLRAALEIDPRCSGALVELGGSLYALGRFDEAAETFELALEYAPQDEGALTGLADALVALKRYEVAEAKLQELLEEQPRNVAAWLQLGDIAIFRGAELQAREYYQKAATLRPESAVVVARAQARLNDITHERAPARGAKEE